MNAFGKEHYKRTLGPAAPEYLKSGFTEVVVYDKNMQQIAHFTGPFARKNAEVFVNAIESEK